MRYNIVMSKFKEDFRRAFLRVRANIWRKRCGGIKLWLNIIMMIFLVIVLFSAHKEIVRAWHILWHANLYLILLLIPLQFMSYYANTEVFFSYLRQRGQLKDVSRLQATGMALEFTFVDHVFPAAGVAGASYMVWRLKHHGVPTGQATMTQVMRFLVVFGTFMVLMLLALIWATVQNLAAHWVVVSSAVAITVLLLVLLFGNYIFGNKIRIISFSHWLADLSNRFGRMMTFGRRKRFVAASKLDKFFLDFNEDVSALKRDRKLLKQPIAWSFAFNLLDVSLFFVTFLALGVVVDPSVLLIAYGAATICGNFMITPGGIGAYEAMMVTVLATGGVDSAMALTGVMLARMLLLMGTLSTGFIAYQYALHKYGRPSYQEEIETKHDQRR